MRARLNLAVAGGVEGYYKAWQAIGGAWFYDFSHDATDDVFNIRRGPFGGMHEARADFARYGSIEE